MTAWEKAGLNREQVAAWEQAGFRAVWVGPHKEFTLIVFSENMDKLDVSKAVPAFKIRSLKPGLLESLPVPISAFGLELKINIHITDTSIKEITEFQQLTYLDLWKGIQITDAAVDELEKALLNCKIDRPYF